MEVTLLFNCPTYVVVDLETSEIVKVVVDDGAPTDWHESAFDYNGEAVPDVERSRAIAIADDGEWPAWEFGW